MRACFCSLAGTRHCDTCSNGPSRSTYTEVIKLARPIGDTPTLYGKEASDFLNRMVEPLTEKDQEFKKRYDNTRKVSFNSNKPSSLAFDITPGLRDIDPQIKTVSLTNFDLDIPESDSIKETIDSLEEEFDPVKKIMAVLKEFDYYAKKER